ncbi:MAG: aldose epimerase family protein [Candidatus Cyclobacteriaceae bacterium M3_2C_046]
MKCAFYFLLFLLGLALGCTSNQSSQDQPISLTERDDSAMKIEKTSWGNTSDGEAVDLFTLTNADGMEAMVSNYGGSIVGLKVPDKNGDMADVVLGFENLQDYQEKGGSFGCIVGRFANRIAGGEFSLNGEQYQLEVNSPPNHIHGGKFGFCKRVWQAREFKSNRGVGVRLNLHSPDGEGNYPGNLDVQVEYLLTPDNALEISYHATTDKPTILNLTNHAYFNLAGQDQGSILDHRIMINAVSFTPVDENLIPTGDIAEVEGTPFDFSQYQAIGEGIEADHPQIQIGSGYDHNFVIRGNPGSLRTAAKVYDPGSGRLMIVMTTSPGMQFYTGNFLSGVSGKEGAIYARRTGFALETQHFPDSPNQPDFPSVTLNPGENYRQTTIYRFSIMKDRGEAM